ncbi:hypothetical protein BDQ12DRAFT_372603 [Crucibulum laeve]|uniref:Uncharacterized protein n=1 Tax=Crucibulum laeve TaxID=68775 RepID=A0A5C3LZZ3_9AGAR|nr:hypothetical protein BDQ12DRAFT_372603 [Crucibulum laeve]
MTDSPSLETKRSPITSPTLNTSHPPSHPSSNNAIMHSPATNAAYIPVSSSTTNPNSNAALSALLTDSFREVEALRRELSAMRKRADKAERLLDTFTRVAEASSTSDPGVNGTPASNTSPNASSSPSSSKLSIPESVARHILDLEERTNRAEILAQEADARRAHWADNWAQVDRYLAAVEMRAADARAGFARVVSGGGEGVVVLQSIPLPGQSPTGGMGPPPTIQGSSRHGREREGRDRRNTQSFPALPPLPNTNPGVGGANHLGAGSRRARTPSVDSYPGQGQPPTKRARGGSDQRDRERRYNEHDYSSSSSNRYPLSSHPSHPSSHPSHLSSHPSSHPSHQQQQQQQQQQSPYPHPNAPRMILPPSSSASQNPSAHGYAPRGSRGRGRSSSQSSASSLDVDEMLLQATTDENGVPQHPAHLSPHASHLSPHPSSHSQHHGHGHRSRSRISQGQQQPAYPGGAGGGAGAGGNGGGMHPVQQQHQQGYPANQSQPRRVGVGASASTPVIGTQQQQAAQAAGVNGQAGAGGPGGPEGGHPFQTHVFAPVVTGAPTKKSKFGAGEYLRFFIIID